jgi:hypothetical protein
MIDLKYQETFITLKTFQPDDNDMSYNSLGFNSLSTESLSKHSPVEQK